MNNLSAKSTFFFRKSDEIVTKWINALRLFNRNFRVGARHAGGLVKTTRKWKSLWRVVMECSEREKSTNLFPQTNTPEGDIRHQQRPVGNEEYQTWWRHVNINRKERNKMEKMCKLESHDRVLKAPTRRMSIRVQKVTFLCTLIHIFPPI